MRHVSIPTTRIQTWLIADSRGACWNAVGPQSGHVIGGRCFSAAGVGRRILVGTVPRVRASGFEIGLVTDTARAVELRSRDGTTKVLSLTSGYHLSIRRRDPRRYKLGRAGHPDVRRPVANSAPDTDAHLMFAVVGY